MANLIITAIITWALGVAGLSGAEAQLPSPDTAAAPAQTQTSQAASNTKGDKAEVQTLSVKSTEEMKPQPKDLNKMLLAFPVISDIHVQDNDKRSQQKFGAALNDLNQLNPWADALVINGDITSGLPADYSVLSKLMGQLPHPQNTFYTIGNHDFYKVYYNAANKWSPDTFPNGETEAASIGRFMTFTGQSHVYYDAMVKGYPFIFLGSERYQQSDPSNNEDAYLSDEQLSWLKTTLKKKAELHKPIFVFLHQPLPYSVAGTDGWAYNRSVVQYKELRAILEQYPQVIFFSGHTHWDLKLPNSFVQDKIAMAGSSSVEQPMTDDGQGFEKDLDAKESEGLYVQVFENRVVISGRDFYRKSWIPEAKLVVPIPE